MAKRKPDQLSIAELAEAGRLAAAEAVRAAGELGVNATGRDVGIIWESGARATGTERKDGKRAAS